jgi:sugar phosphate isomerase/epimerase
MKLQLMRHLWGIVEPWEDAFPRIKAAGYAGVETSVPAPADEDRFRALLARYDLAYVADIATAGATVDDHFLSFAVQLRRAKALDPLFVNSHSGQDWFSEEEAHAFFVQALSLQAEVGVAVSHETHRSRILYNPWSAQRVLTRLPELQLGADWSHWVVVCERLLGDQADLLRLCAANTLHIHARVGYEEGPQVPDPRAPEYERHLHAHEQWWSWIWESQASRGFTSTTLTPEFGPPGYLHTLPYTAMPVADLWAICDWQAQRQAARFADLGYNS